MQNILKEGIERIYGLESGNSGLTPNSVNVMTSPVPVVTAQSGKTKMGDCYSSPYFMRMYEILKGAHSNYRVNIHFPDDRRISMVDPELESYNLLYI